LWALKGDAQTGLEHFEEALASYDRSIGMDAASPWPWYGKSNALKALGRLQEAAVAHARAMALAGEDDEDDEDDEQD
jgi:tetratricopeptide (TPR) repeat protein